MGSRPWPFGVTWRHRSRDHSTPGSTSYGWSTVTMRLSSTVMETWPFEVLLEDSRKRSVVGWSLLNITLISYTPLRYVRNVAARGVKMALVPTAWESGIRLLLLQSLCRASAKDYLELYQRGSTSSSYRPAVGQGVRPRCHIRNMAYDSYRTTKYTDQMTVLAAIYDIIISCQH